MLLPVCRSTHRWASSVSAWAALTAHLRRVHLVPCQYEAGPGPDLWLSFTVADSAFLGFINDRVSSWRGLLPLSSGDRSQRASVAIYF